MPLVGHLDQQRTFLDAVASGRIHHAWLLAGPVGIGKARFAYEAACHLLAGNAASFEIASDHPTRRLIDAGSHSDFRRLAREEKDGKLAAQISVEQVRSLQPLFQSTPGLGMWRVVIVDSIDDMNRAAANAFLKNLEEPPGNTLFFLISHAPDRLLPTIRSRCRMLRFQPLSEDEVARVVAMESDEVDPAELDAVSALAAGSPGRALRFAGLKVRELFAELERLAAAPTGEVDALAQALAKSLSGKPAQARYEAFVELAPDWLAARARGLGGEALADALALWEKAHQLSGRAVALSLDPQSVVYALASLAGASRRKMKQVA